MAKKKTLGKKARGAAVGFGKTAIIAGVVIVALSTFNRKFGVTDRLQGGLSTIGSILPNAAGETAASIEANADRIQETGKEQFGSSVIDNSNPGQTAIGTIGQEPVTGEQRTQTRPQARTSALSRVFSVRDYSAYPIGSTVTRNNLSFTTRPVSTLSRSTQKLIARSVNKPTVVAVRTVKAGSQPILGPATAAQRAYANAKIAAARAKRTNTRR